MESAPAPTTSNPVGEMIVFSCGGRQAAIPAHMVLGISRATVAAAVPFTEPPIEGIVFHETAPMLQIDLAGLWGGEPRGGQFGLRVLTAKGPVVLRVDGVMSGGRVRERAPASAQPEIEQILAGLVAAEGEAPLPPGASAPAEDGRDIPLLVVGVAGTCFALPAAAVLFAGRHEGCAPLRAGEPYERLVTLAGEMLAGVSLGGWLGQAAADEPWGLVLDGGPRRIAATVSTIHGMAIAHSRQLQTVSHRRGDFVCFLDPSRGALEVIDPGALGGDAAGVETLTRHLGPISDFHTTQGARRHATERRQGLASRNGVVARAGDYACVFPVAASLGILRNAEVPRVPARGAGSATLLDLGAFLGTGARPESGRYILMVRRAGRRPAALLTDSVAPLSPEIRWSPLPALPARVRALFEAIGDDGERCYFLVRESALGRDISRIVSAHGAGCLAGWAQLSPAPDDEPPPP